MFNMTKVELDLLLDVDMYFFFEKEIKGGAFYISKRYSKANNKYLTSYDPKKPANYNTYLDKINLYGYAL